MHYLETLINYKMKYYYIRKFIESGIEDIDEILKHTIDKYHIWHVNKRSKRVVDLKKLERYSNITLYNDVDNETEAQKYDPKYCCKLIDHINIEFHINRE